MPELYDKESGAPVGRISDAQLQFLIDQLEEESSTDRDYYINAATIEMFEAAAAEPALIELLRKALGDREAMDIAWGAPE